MSRKTYRVDNHTNAFSTSVVLGWGKNVREAMAVCLQIRTLRVGSKFVVHIQDSTRTTNRKQYSGSQKVSV